MHVLNTYDFEIETRPGRVHANADALSRIDSTPPTLESEPATEVTVCTEPHRCNLVTADSNWVECCSKAQLRQYQDDDPDIGVILRWKESGDHRPDWKEVSGMST